MGGADRVCPGEAGIDRGLGLLMAVMESDAVRALAATMILGNLLDEIRQRFGRYELIDHWKQGEFHHDIVVRIPDAQGVLPGPILVIATNCNGGVKEIVCFDEPPDRSALWHWRCPQIRDFTGKLPPILGWATTDHWFDPCDLLTNDARSELKAEYRRRQHGGGWELDVHPSSESRRA